MGYYQIILDKQTENIRLKAFTGFTKLFYFTHIKLKYFVVIRSVYLGLKSLTHIEYTSLHIDVLSQISYYYTKKIYSTL